MAIETRIAGKHWSAVQNRDDEKIYANQVDFRAGSTAVAGLRLAALFQGGAA